MCSGMIAGIRMNSVCNWWQVCRGSCCTARKRTNDARTPLSACKRKVCFGSLWKSACLWAVHWQPALIRWRRAVFLFSVDKAKEKAAPATSSKKKTSGDEVELARLQQEFARSNMLSMLVLSVSYFFIFSTVSSHFGSKRVARVCIL